MHITTAQIEVTTTSLTKNIVKQLDSLRMDGSLTKDQAKEQLKPIGRVELPESYLVLFDTPRGVEKLDQHRWWNSAIYNELWGKCEDLPKLILLK